MTALTPAMRHRVRRATRPKEIDATAGELNITPFLDVVVNLVLFLLATTAAVLTTSEVEARLPAYTPHGSGHESGLHLAVTLTASGAIVSTREGTLAPGCESVGVRGSVAVAPGPGGVDRTALERCAALLHDRDPSERSVILTADAMVPYADVITAMDALRGPDDDRFDDVLLSAGVR